MKQYCVYCASCVNDGGLYCDKLDKEMSRSYAQHENHCAEFVISPMGHVITGKQYRPQKWRWMRIYTRGDGH